METSDQPVIISDENLSPLPHTKKPRFRLVVAGAYALHQSDYMQSQAKASSLLCAYDARASTPNCRDPRPPGWILSAMGVDCNPVDHAAKRLQAFAGGQLYRYVWDQDAPNREGAEVAGDIVYPLLIFVASLYINFDILF